MTCLADCWWSQAGGLSLNQTEFKLVIRKSINVGVMGPSAHALQPSAPTVDYYVSDLLISYRKSLYSEPVAEKQIRASRLSPDVCIPYQPRPDSLGPHAI